MARPIPDLMRVPYLPPAANGRKKFVPTKDPLMSAISLSVSHDAHAPIELSLLRKVILDKIFTDIADKNFCLQYGNSLIIHDLSTLDIIKHFQSFGKVITTNNDALVIMRDDACIVIHYNDRESYKVLYYTIFAASLDFIRLNHSELLALLSPIMTSVASVDIRWYYTDNNRSNYSYVTEIIDDVVYKEAYPYIEDMDGFIDDYLKGNEHVLILIGPPGTGKTRLIRQILRQMALNRSAEEHVLDNGSIADSQPFTISYTTDIHVLESESIFIDLLSEDVHALVIEDIDFHLKSRKEGNDFMYKLLAASDGLITNINRKIIVSTNLRNVDDIDEALLRPGRCYGIVKTRRLTNLEANKFVKAFSPDVPKFDRTDSTLAEIYRFCKQTKQRLDAVQPKKLGF